MLGTPIKQNIHRERFVEVKDMGKSMKEGGRYHQTREGGSLHTDSPQWSDIPDYLGLLCLHHAKQGGESILISAYTLHNKLMQQHPELLKLLYEKFHFDKRGEFKEGENPVTDEPIFSVDDNGLNFRYLFDYIRDGHKVANDPLTEEKQQALEEVNKLLDKDDSFIVTMTMKAGQIQFINNHRVIHGRTPFEDFPEEEKKRVLLRSWVKKTA